MNSNKKHDNKNKDGEIREIFQRRLTKGRLKALKDEIRGLLLSSS